MVSVKLKLLSWPKSAIKDLIPSWSPEVIKLLKASVNFSGLSLRAAYEASVHTPDSAEAKALKDSKERNCSVFLTPNFSRISWALGWDTLLTNCSVGTASPLFWKTWVVLLLAIVTGSPSTEKGLILVPKDASLAIKSEPDLFISSATILTLALSIWIPSLVASAKTSLLDKILASWTPLKVVNPSPLPKAPNLSISEVILVSVKASEKLILSPTFRISAAGELNIFSRAASKPKDPGSATTLSLTISIIWVCWASERLSQLSILLANWSSDNFQTVSPLFTSAILSTTVSAVSVVSTTVSAVSISEAIITSLVSPASSNKPITELTPLEQRLAKAPLPIKRPIPAALTFLRISDVFNSFKTLSLSSSLSFIKTSNSFLLIFSSPISCSLVLFSFSGFSFSLALLTISSLIKL